MDDKGSMGESSSILPDKDEFENRTFTALTRALDDNQAKKAYQGDADVIDETESRLIENFRTTFRLLLHIDTFQS